jgi:hypothetical protein
MDQHMSGSSELFCSVQWNHRWYYAYWLVHWSNSCIWSCCYRRIRVSQVSIKTSLYFVGSRWSWSDAGHGFWTWSQGDFKPNIIGLVSLLVFLFFVWVCQCVCVCRARPNCRVCSTYRCKRHELRLLDNTIEVSQSHRSLRRSFT